MFSLELAHLGSAQVDERNRATSSLKAILGGLERKGDEAALRRALKDLCGYRDRATDGEVRNRLSEVIAFFRGGATIWEFDTGQFPEGSRGLVSFVCADRKALILGGKDWLASRDWDSGEPIWDRKPVPVEVTALLVRGKTLIAGGTGWLGRYDADTGKQMWLKEKGSLPGDILQLILHEDKVVVGGCDGSQFTHWVGVYDGRNGKTLWERNGSELPEKAALRNVGGAVFGSFAHSFHLSVVGKRVVAAGIGSNDSKGSSWLGSYELESGKPACERHPQDFPRATAYMMPCPDGKSVLMGGGEEIEVAKDLSGVKAKGWLGCYGVETFQPIWDWKRAEHSELESGCLHVEARGDQFLARGVLAPRLRLGFYDMSTGKPSRQETQIMIPGFLTGLVEARQDRVLASGVTADGKGRWCGCYDLKTEKPIWERKGNDAPAGEIVGDAEGFFSLEVEIPPQPTSQLITRAWVGAYEMATGKTAWRRSLRGRGEVVSQVSAIPLAITPKAVIVKINCLYNDAFTGDCTDVNGVVALRRNDFTRQDPPR